MFRALELLSAVMEKIGAVLVGIYAAISFVVVCLEVFSRMSGHAISWTEELARWLLVGMCFIGASVALRQRRHVGITGVIKLLPGRWRKIVLLPCNISIMLFLVFLFLYGLKLTIDQAWQTGAVLLVSMVFVRVNIPLGALFMFVHMLYFTALLFRDKNPDSCMIAV